MLFRSGWGSRVWPSFTNPVTSSFTCLSRACHSLVGTHSPLIQRRRIDCLQRPGAGRELGTQLRSDTWSRAQGSHHEVRGQRRKQGMGRCRDPGGRWYGSKGYTEGLAAASAEPRLQAEKGHQDTRPDQTRPAQKWRVTEAQGPVQTGRTPIPTPSLGAASQSPLPDQEGMCPGVEKLAHRP